jgi:carbamoyl-phosphate synthase large subunit
VGSRFAVAENWQSIYERACWRETAVQLAGQLLQLGFSLVATEGTAQAIQAAGIACATVFKVRQGSLEIVDMIKSGEISYIVNTTAGKQAIEDSRSIRRSALQYLVPYTTTIAAAEAMILVLHSDQPLVVIKLA